MRAAMRCCDACMPDEEERASRIRSYRSRSELCMSGRLAESPAGLLGAWLQQEHGDIAMIMMMMT
jgi:hypothetical protein